MGPNDWHAMAQAFLATSRGDDAQGAQKAKKKLLYRLKSMEIMTAIGNWCVVVRGVGIAVHLDDRFKTQRPAVFEVQWPVQSCPQDRSWLWLISDRLSANLTPINWLVYEAGVLVVHHGDFSHDTWNEVKGAAAETGFSFLARLLLIVANTLYGQLDSGGFWAKTVQAAHKYKEQSSSECAIFRLLLHRIASDRWFRDGRGLIQIPPPCCGMLFACLHIRLGFRARVACP